MAEQSGAVCTGEKKRTLEQAIDDGLQQALTSAGHQPLSAWEAGLSQLVAEYVRSSLPYHLLAYSDSAPPITSFAGVAQLLNRLRAHRGLPQKRARSEQPPTDAADGSAADATSVHGTEEEVRAMLLPKGGRVYLEEDDGMYECSSYTNEWAVLQGEHLTLQQLPEQPATLVPTSPSVAPSSSSSSASASAAPVPPPISALRFPVAIFDVCAFQLYNKRSRRSPPDLSLYYTAQQLSFHLWERPDGVTEGAEGGRAGQPPGPNDDPLPRLTRAMQTGE